IISIVFAFVLVPAMTYAAPGSFVINKPGDTFSPGPLISSNTLEFAWNAAAGALSYELNVRDVTDSPTGPLDIFPVNATSRFLTLYPGRSYKWNVTAYSGLNQTGTFTISSNSRWFRLGLCDLTVSGTVSVTPNSAYAGLQVRIDYAVTNAGTGDSVQCLNRIQIKPGTSGTILVEDHFPMPALNAHQSINLSAFLTLPPTTASGSYSVYVIVDSTDLNVQSDISNDIHSDFNIFSVSAPNLTPYKPSNWFDKIVVSRQSNATTDTSDLSPSDTVYVSWAGINSGGSSPSQNFFTTLYLDNAFVSDFVTSTSPLVTPGSVFFY